MRTAAASLALAVCLAAGAAGQDPTPLRPPPDLGELLRTARETGALGRVLGEHWFLLQERGQHPALVRLRVQVCEEPPCVALEAVMQVQGRDTVVCSQVLVGWDGMMQAFRSGVVDQGRREEREGRVYGDRIRLRISKDGKDSTDEIGWHPGAIPGQFVLWVLPALADQGMQPKGYAFTQFDEGTGKGGPRQLEVNSRQPSEVGPGSCEVVISDPARPRDVQVVVLLDDVGRIVSLTRGPHSNITRLSPEAASRWLSREETNAAARRALGEAPPLIPPDEPPPGVEPPGPPPASPAPTEVPSPAPSGAGGR